MSNFEVLAVAYVFSIIVTILAAVVYLAAEIKNGGGIEKYFVDRGFRCYKSSLTWSIIMIVMISWIMTPVATILCHNTWLHNNDPSY